MFQQWRRVVGPVVLLRGFGQAAEFVGFVFLARHLGTASFGRLAVAFLVSRYAGLVADWGASVRGARDVAVQSDPAAIHSLVRLRYLLSAGLSVAFVGVVLGLSHPALAWLAVAIAARGMSRDWLALGREHGVRSGIPAVIQGVILAGGAAAVHAEASAACVIAAAYGVAAVTSVVLNRLPPASNDERVSVNAWILVAVLADQVTASTDAVLLAALRSASQAGIYAAVYRIPNAWITIIGLLVVGFVPITARTLTTRPDALTALVARAKRVGLAAGGLIVITIPVAYVLVPIVFGHAYRSGQMPLVVLLAATAVNAIAAPFHPLYLALQRDRALAGISLAAAGLNFVANLVVIPLVGMIGAASTTLGAQVLLLVVLWNALSQAARNTGSTA